MLIESKKTLFSIILIALHVVFLDYGTLCLFDHDLDLYHGVEASNSPSSHHHNESEDSKSSPHSCLIAQNLLSAVLVSILVPVAFVLTIYRQDFLPGETFHQILNLFGTSRSPPSLELSF
jgi:hypothetical protein